MNYDHTMQSHANYIVSEKIVYCSISGLDCSGCPITFRISFLNVTHKEIGDCVLSFSGRNSDINLAVLEKEPNKEDDRTILLEGGLTEAAPKTYLVPTTSHLLR